MEATYERVVEEREIVRKAFAEADTERLRLLKENEELRTLMQEGAVFEVMKQLREARMIIKDLVEGIALPFKHATGKRAKLLRDVIQNYRGLLDQAVAEIYKLRQ